MLWLCGTYARNAPSLAFPLLINFLLAFLNLQVG